MKVSANIENMRTWIMLLFASVAICSCDSILDEPKADCSVSYKVKFKYDYNMKYADAFAHEVKSVTLYAFDKDGKLAFQRIESGEALAKEDYSMPVDVEPGDYDLLAWAGLDGEESFAVPILQLGESTMDGLTCTMNRKYGAITRAGSSTAYVDEDLRPLFHGQVKRQVFTRAANNQIVTVPLVKNTNNVRIVLQHLSGETVDVSKFTFTIEDENGLMNYDNTLLRDEKLTYLAWRTDQGTAEMEPNSRAMTSVGVAIAELTVGRLVKDNKPMLRIYNDKDALVLSIPLIDYALLVKGYYNHAMTDQEYLDRQDEYNMTFFLDENDSWVNSVIMINGWKIVLNDVEL